MNPQKKSRRYRASVSIQALDLAISRFTNSLGFDTFMQSRPLIYFLKLSGFEPKELLG
jgi:hypothetical protein